MRALSKAFELPGRWRLPLASNPVVEAGKVAQDFVVVEPRPLAGPDEYFRLGVDLTVTAAHSRPSSGPLPADCDRTGSWRERSWAK
jgi:hypothetical protein